MNNKFRECYTNEPDTSEALRCCLNECGDDYSCQQRCIDSYNSLIPVEEFTLQGIPKGISFLLITTLITILISAGWFPFLPVKLVPKSIFIFLMYFSIYIVLSYV